MIRRARARAKKRGLDFAVEVHDILPLPQTCPVLGIRLRKSAGPQDPQAYSLDRIDNSKGYVPGNVAVMSYLANRLKNDGTAEQHAAIAGWMMNALRQRYWKITVSGWGTLFARGSEEQAEEWRSHKANWEHAVARKFEVTESASEEWERLEDLL